MESKKMNNRDFIGSWELMEWTVETKEGNKESPFGNDLTGQITYDAHGNMSVLIMKNKRPPFASGDPLKGRPEEITDAYNGFIAYSGSYDVNAKENIVTHKIKISSFPNWVDQDQPRKFEFAENILNLSTGFIGEYRHMLVWRKAGS